MNTNNLSSIVQDLSSNLTLNKLKNLIEPFKNTKILIAITARAEIRNYILENVPTVKMKENDLFFNSPDSFMGVNFYVVNSQIEPVKYWYNNQQEELKEYLNNNDRVFYSKGF